MSAEILLQRTVVKVFKDTLDQYLRPTGDLEEFKKKYPGTAPPPQELGRCLDFYIAVNSGHCRNFYALREKSYSVLRQAIDHVNGVDTSAELSPEAMVSGWITACGTDKGAVRAVFDAAIGLVKE